MKKAYTKQQIQEAIVYWQKQLDESLFKADDPVKKFFGQLKSALKGPHPVMICASKKNGITYGVYDFNILGGSVIRLVSGDKKPIDGDDFITRLVDEGLSANDIKEIYVDFPDGSGKLDDVKTVNGSSSRKGPRTVIIVYPYLGKDKTDAFNRFFG